MTSLFCRITACLGRVGALALTLALAPSLLANTAPTAASMATGVYENDVLEVYAPGVLANATDAENDPLTAVQASAPAHGALTFNADGSFTYTPNAGFAGDDTFDFWAYDGEFLSNAATVFITVVAVNTPPVALSRAFDVIEDAAFTEGAPGVLQGASDAEGDAIAAQLVSGPAHGQLTLNSDGSFTYMPDANYNGPDAFTICPHDGTEAGLPVQMTLNVQAANDAPQGGDVSVSLDEDSTITVSGTEFMANFSDPDGDLLTVLIISGPSKGTLAMQPDNTWTYQPAPDFNGIETFEFALSDGMETAGPFKVTLNVQPVNDAPLANGEVYNLLEDASLSVKPAEGVLANDSDVDGDTFSAILALLPRHGTIVFNADGSFEYVPEADFNGTDAFAYYATDGVLQSQIVTVALNIQELNDAPAFVASGDVSVMEDSGAYADQWARAIIAGPADESWQSVRFELVISQSSSLFAVDPQVSADGRLSFELLADAWGTADITVVLRDNGGEAMPGDVATSPSFSFRIFVLATNDAPSFIGGGNVIVNEDCGSQTLQWATGISAGAGDVGDGLAFDVQVPGLTALFADMPRIDANGVLRFTPAQNANGRVTVDVRLYEVADDGSALENGLSSITQSFVIQVRAVNDAPSFTSGAVSVRGSGAVILAGWAGSISAGPADEAGQALGFQIMDNDNPALFDGQPEIDADGTLRFTVAKGVKGAASIMVRLIDNGGIERGGENASAIQTFNITVDGEEGAALVEGGSCTTGGGQGAWLWLLVPALALALRRARKGVSGGR